MLQPPRATSVCLALDLVKRARQRAAQFGLEHLNLIFAEMFAHARHQLIDDRAVANDVLREISPGYYDMNIVAFYMLKGKLLLVFYGLNNGIADQCIVIPGVAIATTLNAKLGFDFAPLLMVMSAREGLSRTVRRATPDHGIAVSLYCEANTMPKVQPPTS
jgi:hypothetical protein